jgi:hypothetical protein
MPMTFALHANVLAPGDSNVLPDVFTVSGNPPVLGDNTGTFNFGNGTITGTWESIVLVDPLGVTCAGCLDFVFQVSVDGGSAASLFALTLGRFTGYSTDVGYVDGTGYAPSFVSRGAPDGIPIGFNLIRNMSALPPGGSTAFFVVATNATAYDNRGIASLASFAFVDRTNLRGQIGGLFEPASVPEPATALFVCFGLAGLAALRSKR